MGRASSTGVRSIGDWYQGSSPTPHSTAGTGSSAFFTGAVVREVLVDLDDKARRLAWTVVDGPYTHHNAFAQVFPAGDDGTRFVWIADLLPDEAAVRVGELMERGINTVKQTLEHPA